MLEQQRAETVVLIRVGDEQSEVRRLLVQPLEDPDAEQPVVTERTQRVVSAARWLREPHEVVLGGSGAGAEEAQIIRALGCLLVQLDDRRQIRCAEITKMDDDAVGGQRVRVVAGEREVGHLPALPCSTTPRD
ncbi:MAG TPA: hypothetical protein VFU35_12150 [Jatrophihabitans sp.]|nr:hypothetical protein [Jatrophihabitans sp.]